jgi:hypothetical protein
MKYIAMKITTSIRMVLIPPIAPAGADCAVAAQRKLESIVIPPEGIFLPIHQDIIIYIPLFFNSFIKFHSLASFTHKKIGAFFVQKVETAKPVEKRFT